MKLGTIFSESPLGLDKWLPAVWLVANSKNGISSHELARALGITQKSAWFMVHRIRLAMQTGTFEKLDGEVEADEAFIGGKSKNMHADKRAKKITGRGAKDKTIVFGVRQRGARIHAEVIPNPQKVTIHSRVKAHVKPGSKLYTDTWKGYNGLDEEYERGIVDHAERYVEGRIHTNGLENFWALLKRGLHGTYVSVEPKHLSRYLDERVFTYNMRGLSDYGRFSAVLGAVSGRRLTWDELTGKA